MILKGDCIEVMKAMKPNSVDAIVTDPPYGLEFMGKEWDKLRSHLGRKDLLPSKQHMNLDPWEKIGKVRPSGFRPKRNPWCRKCGKYKFAPHASKCFCKESDWNMREDETGRQIQAWHQGWLTEAYRVLKPGGSMLVMGGTRTSHRLACAIEDSGFIIKDTIMWIYGSGFPKCQDITSMIDAKMLGITTKQVKERRKVIGESPYKKLRGIASKRGELYGKGLNGSGEFNITLPLTPEAKHWDGFKVGGIKPAYESIIWAIRPPEGSYVDNILKYGVGFVNVDATRVGVPQKQESPVSLAYRTVYGDIHLSFLDSLFYIDSIELSVVQDALLYIASVLRSYNNDNKDPSHNGDGQDGKKQEGVFYDILLNRLYPNGKWCGLTLYEVLNFQGDCQTCSHFYDEQIHKVEVSAQESAPSLADALFDMSEGLSKLLHSHDCQSSHLSSEGVLFHISAFIHLLLIQDTTILHYINSPVKRMGRFPANIILSHHPECVQVGVKRVKGLGGSGRASDKGHGFQTEYVAGNKKGEGFGGGFVDKNGLEIVESWDCHPDDCPVRLLDEQSGVLKSGNIENHHKRPKVYGRNSYFESKTVQNTNWQGDSGGASRFFYCAKASRAERNTGLEGMEEKAVPYSEYRDKYDSTKSWVSEYPDGKERPMNKLKNSHPTVKPIKLFEWLIKLVTRGGQIVLDPFIGSGTTSIAAHNTGRKCIGIEKEDEYLEIAKRRIDYWENQPKQMEMRV